MVVLRSGRVVKPWVKKKRKPRAVSALTTRVRKLEKKTSGIESKFLDTAVASAAIATTPTLSNLNLMIQGVNIGERVGDSITITSIYLKGVISMATAGDNNMVRLLCFHDKQANGASAALGDILLSGAASVHVFQPLNLDNKHRFRILWDKTIQLNDEGYKTHVFSKYIKCNIKCRYDTTLGTIADLTSSNVGFFFGGFTALGEIQLTSRIRYLDS